MSVFSRNMLAGICAIVLLGVYSTTTLAEENKESAPILKLVDGYYPEYPATKPTDESKADLVKKGEYLSKIGDCISCHTNVKQRTPAYAGGLPIATPFGTFYSPNITPDKETGIGKWTKDDFLHALKHGKNPDGQNYFPVFPFVYFANITEEDSEALYEYLMSIPPVHQQNIPLPFPFNMPGARFSLLGWDLLFFYPNKVDTLYVPGQSEQWNRGRYIVDGLGHCSMCHTPLNPLGATKDKHYLTGAFIDDFWAPNITKLGLESASEQEVADIFKSNKLLHNAGPVAGPMAEVIHNSLKYLTDDDRMAISIYLKSVESEEYLGVPPSNNPPSLSRGRQVYLSACIECHQNGEMTAPIIGNSANWTNRLKEAGIEKLYKNVIYGYNSMPIKGACVTCSENDIISAVDYILDKSLSRSDKLSLEKEKTKLHPKTGKEIYDSNCAVCHNNGKDGAPKIGDTQIWNSKIKQNFDVLVKNTVFGNNHPKNGDCKTCNTGDIVEAIKYILKESNTDGDYNLW